MKFSDVRKLMERNRALTEFSSLPFVITKDGEKTVTWFNFSLGKSEDQLCVKVREILDTKDGVELNKEASQIAVPADKAKNSVPEITEKEYYQELEKIYEKYSRKEMEAEKKYLKLLKSRHLNHFLKYLLKYVIGFIPEKYKSIAISPIKKTGIQFLMNM